jgi:ligand-binding sensor domain-containing protein
MPDSDERKRELIGRRYVSLAADQSEIFSDVELGELDKLTRNSDETYSFAPLSYKQRAAPTGVFDAVADSDGWVLLATAHGLLRLRLEDGHRKPIASPSLGEEIKSICRDGQGRLWVAGRRLYVSSDEGKRWNNVELPMVSDTYTKRVRPNPMAPGLIVALHDRGVVFLDW